VKIINENVSCYTCKYTKDVMSHPKERHKACRKCVTQNGYKGWEPAPGVKVQETKGWTFTGTGKPVETLFRKVAI